MRLRIGRSISILGDGRLCSSQSRHEVIGLVRVLTFAAVDVGQRGADLAKAKGQGERRFL